LAGLDIEHAIDAAEPVDGIEGAGVGLPLRVPAHIVVGGEDEVVGEAERDAAGRGQVEPLDLDRRHALGAYLAAVEAEAGAPAQRKAEIALDADGGAQGVAEAAVAGIPLRDLAGLELGAE